MSTSPEHILQKQIVQALRFNGFTTVNCDPMSGLKHLPPNTSKRYVFVNFLKDTGYSVGQPDIAILLRNGETLWVELKNGKKGRQSDEQKYFEEKAKWLGHNYVIWRTLDDAMAFIKGYRLMILKGEVNGFAKDDNTRAFDLIGKLDRQEQADK